MSDVLVAPAWHHVPEHVETYGPEVADLADSAGMTLDGEQRLVLDAMYAVRRGGQLAATEAGLVCARQNLKTHVYKAAALADLVLFEVPDALWTAHLMRTSTKAFTEMKALFTDFDHLRRLVARVSDANGEEGIELLSGARLDFMARGPKAGRGLSGRRITLDEALFLVPSTVGALVPVLSAQTMTGESVQIRYGSSAGKAESAVLRAVRDRGRSGTEPRLTYTEWAAAHRDCASDGCAHAPGTEACALDDVGLLAQANPALGRRISLDFVLTTERAAMTPEDFARERLGWWEDPPASESSAIDLAKWSALADPSAERGSAQTFAVATAPDRSWSAIAVAWSRPDTGVQVMLADYKAGASWVADRVAELRSRWGGSVTVNTAARGLVDDADEPSAEEQAQAHNAFGDAVEAGTVRHGNEPALNVSVRAARWRPRGDSRVLDRKGSTDISPLDAAALAYAVASHPVGGWMVGV